jgi:hypothetical protein
MIEPTESSRLFFCYRALVDGVKSFILASQSSRQSQVIYFFAITTEPAKSSHLFFCYRALASEVKSLIFLLSRPSRQSQVVYLSVAV